MNTETLTNLLAYARAKGLRAFIAGKTVRVEIYHTQANGNSFFSVQAVRSQKHLDKVLQDTTKAAT